jgi:flavin-dependent dehydrogenase
VRPTVDNGRVTGVAGPEGSIRCRFVVDASGGRHWLARRLGLGIEFRSPRLTAWYGYCNGDCPSRDEAPQIQADDQGWVWTARVAAGRYAWTRLLLDGGSGPPAPPGELAGLEPDGRSRASDVTWRSVPRSAGPGYFVAGDAAWVLDPASSHGVLKALMSGIQAGDCIDRSIKGAGDLQASHAYSNWMDGWFRHDLSVLRKLYLQLPRPPWWLEGPTEGRSRSDRPGLKPAARTRTPRQPPSLVPNPAPAP